MTGIEMVKANDRKIAALSIVCRRMQDHNVMRKALATNRQALVAMTVRYEDLADPRADSQGPQGPTTRPNDNRPSCKAACLSCQVTPWGADKSLCANLGV
jgi:hypothetical protein